MKSKTNPLAPHRVCGDDGSSLKNYILASHCKGMGEEMSEIAAAA